jgi:hypothetical protein
VKILPGVVCDYSYVLHILWLDFGRCCGCAYVPLLWLAWYFHASEIEAVAWQVSLGGYFVTEDKYYLFLCGL